LSDLNSFNATQGEEGGIYISGVAKNTALTAAGVPVSPIAR
jgi:hypothetical protein